MADKPFFAGLVTYMSSGPVIAMVWEGLNAVKEGRKVWKVLLAIFGFLSFCARIRSFPLPSSPFMQMLGATKPSDSAPGTIRGDYALDVSMP